MLANQRAASLVTGSRALPYAPGRWRCVRVAAAAPARTITITQLATGASTVLTQSRIVIGCGDSCDIKVSGDGVAAEHASIETKAQQLFARPLVGEELFDDSSCRLDDTDLRPRVNYLLGSGAIMSVGTPPGVKLKIEFQEGSGSNPMMEMMMQGMAAGNAEVRDALGKAKK